MSIHIASARDQVPSPASGGTAQQTVVQEDAVQQDTQPPAEPTPKTAGDTKSTGDDRSDASLRLDSVWPARPFEGQELFVWLKVGPELQGMTEGNLRMRSHQAAPWRTHPARKLRSTLSRSNGSTLEPELRAEPSEAAPR